MYGELIIINSEKYLTFVRCCYCMNLDETDLGLLELLLEDGRMSFNDLAKRLGISTPTVSARLRNLEELGVIQGFHVKLDHDKLDHLTVVSTMDPQAGKAEELVEELVGNEMVREVYSLDTGALQLKATLPGGADIRVLLDFLNNRELVKSYRWNVILKTHKEVTRAYITAATRLNQPCDYCKSPIQGNPVKHKLDTRTRYFCCPICQREYVKRREKLKKRVGPD